MNNSGRTWPLDFGKFLEGQLPQGGGSSLMSEAFRSKCRRRAKVGKRGKFDHLLSPYGEVFNKTCRLPWKMPTDYQGGE